MLLQVEVGPLERGCMGDRLRVLWDFDDLDGTWERFQQALEQQASAAERAEVPTQLARVQGLQGDLAAGDRLLDEAETAAVDSPLTRPSAAAGQHEEALLAFQRALRARERNPSWRAEIEIARYAVARTLRGLGRPAAAAVLLEEAVAWTRTVGEPDGWFHEELAEAYAALGREADARQQARLAFALLKATDPSFKEDAGRASRLRALADEAPRLRQSGRAWRAA
jgi:tetratricopeptide (TPR) repeat protein